MIVFLKRLFDKIKKFNEPTLKKTPNPYLKRSFSQDGEDVMLMAFYEKTPSYKGFYVDIGAHDPFRFSNTQIFYEKGWRGINIDAAKGSMQRFIQYRLDDVNLEVAIGETEELLTFYEFEEGCLNTFDEKTAHGLIKQGQKLKNKSTVETFYINTILDKHLRQGQKIDFINIDVENTEMSILKGLDFEKYAPDYFLIEELQYRDEDFADCKNSDIYNFLSQKGYIIVGKTHRTVLYKKRQFKDLTHIKNEKWAEYETELSNRQTCLDINTIKKISFQINNICNYAPIHPKCPVHNFKTSEVLPTETIHKVLTELGTNEFDGHIMFSVYNEPLTDSRFFDLCKFAKEVCPNCKIYLLTNGFYIKTQADIEKIEECGVDYISISAYTFKEYNRLKVFKPNTGFEMKPMILDEREDIYEREPIECNNPCYATTNDITISSNGDVALCCLDFNKSVIFGNVNEQSLYEIFNSDKMKQAARDLYSGKRCFEICKRCNWERF